MPTFSISNTNSGADLGTFESTMFLYTFIGVAAEHFLSARDRGLALVTEGPSNTEVWAKIGDTWRVAPRQAMPLLIGVHDLGAAARAASMVGGVLRELTQAETRDLLELLEGVER